MLLWQNERNVTEGLNHSHLYSIRVCKRILSTFRTRWRKVQFALRNYGESEAQRYSLACIQLALCCNVKTGWYMWYSISILNSRSTLCSVLNETFLQGSNTDLVGSAKRTARAEMKSQSDERDIVARMQKTIQVATIYYCYCARF